MNRRVVVTGMGAITPVGLDVDNYWSSLKKGISGAGHITKFDTSEYDVKIAAELKDFDSEKYLDKKEARRMDFFCQYAVAAAEEAVSDSGLDFKGVDAN